MQTIKRRKQQQKTNRGRGLYTTGLFCQDLLRKIFLNLPVKTLIRFKLVSKTWFYIITSHNFAKSHYYYYHSDDKSQSPAGNKNHKSSFFLLRHFIHGANPARFITRISDQQECTIHENIFSPYFEIMCGWDIYNPPLFSVGLGLYIVKFQRTSEIALWNPATREIKSLPPSPFPFHEELVSYHEFSFGHAEIKDDDTFSYKVGFIRHSIEDWPYFQLVLYDSSSNSWKVLSCDLGYGRSQHADGINLNRMVHLLSVEDHLNPYIITFDYSSEVFGRMEVPDLLQITGRYYDFYRSFLTLYDHRFLCLVVFWTTTVQRTMDTTFFDVWVMREYGVTESWGKECTIGPARDNLLMQNYEKSTGGVFLELHDKGSRIYLSSCASSSADTNLPVISDTREIIFVFEQHVESLVSINGTSDETRTQQIVVAK